MSARVTLLFCFALLLGAQANWSWSQSVAFDYLYYAYAAYCNPNTITDWSCKWCQEPQVSNFSVVSQPYDSSISGYGFIGVHEQNQTIVVCFRGTDDLENWITDLESAVLVPYKNSSTIKVGDGFYKEWNDLAPQVTPIVSSLVQKYPNYQVWVTGHSLGAAISILCAVELAQEGYPVNVYNYGLPRVGNEDFSDFYRGLVPNTYRVVNGHDIVPHVPFESMGFYHVPTEVWENPAESLTFKVCDGSGEDPTCSDSNTLDTSVYDHLHYLNVEESCS